MYQKVQVSGSLMACLVVSEEVKTKRGEIVKKDKNKFHLPYPSVKAEAKSNMVSSM